MLPRSRDLLLLGALLLAVAGCRAPSLVPSSWVVLTPEGATTSAATDDDLATAWTSRGPQCAGMALTVDLGRPCIVHRVYLHPGTRSQYPRGLRVSVGEAGRMAVVAERELPRTVETDVRFNPAVGRLVTLEIAGEGAGYPWSVAELRVFGSAEPRALTPRDCVVADPDAPGLLRMAAEDLRYYVGELSGRPIPLVAPDQAAGYPGTVYRVVSPPTFGSYEQLIADPRFPHRHRVSIRHEGREVRFSGLSTRATFDAVAVFLEKQGVRWVYPGPMGDWVPRRRGIDLGLLPIDEEPSFAVRHANFNVQRYVGHPWYRWFLRTRWNLSWGNALTENPGFPRPEKRPSFGFPHSFNALVPGEAFKEHPDWFPLLRDPKWTERIGKDKLGHRIPYGTTYGMNFCTTGPGVADYVAKRILEKCQPHTLHDTAWVIPMDASCWCECDTCLALDDPDQFERRTRYERSKSNRHSTFIRQVAERVREGAPNLAIGTLAYESYHQPPSRIARLPENVVIDFLWYGHYTLPLTASKRNAWLKERLDGWARIWPAKPHHAIYDWALLLPGKNPMPIPLVSALADKVAYAHGLGVRSIGTEGSPVAPIWRQNPWNFYAYARLAWNAHEPPEQILREFFTGYYHEAAEPMLRTYTTLERHLIENDIGLGDNLHYALTPGSFPLHIVERMEGHLGEAERRARQWFVKERVADARRGLDWVVARQGFARVRTGAGGGEGGFPVVPADGRPLVLLATQVSIHTVGGADRDQWNLWHYGRLGEHVRFERAGAHTMTVCARADLFEGHGAQMVVHVGPRRFGPIEVATKELKTYSIPVAAPAGVWEVAVEFVSDGIRGDRNLYVGQIRLAAARP